MLAMGGISADSLQVVALCPIPQHHHCSIDTFCMNSGSDGGEAGLQCASPAEFPTVRLECDIVDSPFLWLISIRATDSISPITPIRISETDSGVGMFGLFFSRPVLPAGDTASSSQAHGDDAADESAPLLQEGPNLTMPTPRQPSPYEMPDAEGKCFLLDLPDEVLVKVFSQLDRSSVSKCLRVSLCGGARVGCDISYTLLSFQWRG